MRSFEEGARMPVLCIPHGGGPLPLLRNPTHSSLTNWLRTAAQDLPTPVSILIISAHWEERQPTVTSNMHPPLLYDYHGFPTESYSIKYDAPGSPELAQRTADVLKAAGLSCKSDSKRGWDHGVFVALKLLYPAADIPVVEMSLLDSLSAEEHIKLGEALAPLQDEGVMIIGSGMSYHSMQGFAIRGRGGTKSTNADSQEFDAYIQDALLNPKYSPQERRQLLIHWEKGPAARACHPREEHLLPLMVAAGAARCRQAQLTYDGNFLGAKVSGFSWS